jgi:hypothetical protein
METAAKQNKTKRNKTRQNEMKKYIKKKEREQFNPRAMTNFDATTALITRS